VIILIKSHIAITLFHFSSSKLFFSSKCVKIFITSCSSTNSVAQQQYTKGKNKLQSLFIFVVVMTRPAPIQYPQKDVPKSRVNCFPKIRFSN